MKKKPNILFLNVQKGLSQVDNANAD